jgi:PAS domain S-box-containing protein
MMPDKGSDVGSTTFTVLINRRRIILVVSSEVLSALGYTEDELLGLDVLDFIHVEDSLPARAVLRLDYPLPVSGAVRLRSKTGHWALFAWKIAARVLHDTSLAYLVYVQSVPNPR